MLRRDLLRRFLGLVAGAVALPFVPRPPTPAVPEREAGARGQTDTIAAALRGRDVYTYNRTTFGKVNTHLSLSEPPAAGDTFWVRGQHGRWVYDGERFVFRSHDAAGGRA